jgi:hypothetical protein
MPQFQFRVSASFGCRRFCSGGEPRTVPFKIDESLSSGFCTGWCTSYIGTRLSAAPCLESPTLYLCRILLAPVPSCKPGRLPPLCLCASLSDSLSCRPQPMRLEVFVLPVFYFKRASTRWEVFVLAIPIVYAFKSPTWQSFHVRPRRWVCVYVSMDVCMPCRLVVFGG